MNTKTVIAILALIVLLVAVFGFQKVTGKSIIKMDKDKDIKIRLETN